MQLLMEHLEYGRINGVEIRTEGSLLSVAPFMDPEFLRLVETMGGEAKMLECLESLAAKLNSAD